MKRNGKLLFLALIFVAILIIATGCSAEQTPYEKNDAENYTVSIKYDANGGTFTTNTHVITDSYNLGDLPVNGNGKAEVALLSPDHAARGNDAFTATKNGYFLAGWYAKRTETMNADGTKSYSYSEKWDFEQDLLELDKNKTYSSAEPVMTLYAAWVPMFEVEFYDYTSKEPLGKYTYNPTADSVLNVPSWNMETGIIDMYKFPTKDGYTFEKAYYDAEGTQAIETEMIVHPGVIDAETGTASNTVMKVYVDWKEGNWYHIYTVEQFLKNASVRGSYVIHADLDFAGKNWPTSFMYGNFAGKIEGNGHTFKNITLTQNDNSKINAGVFGNLTEQASITDLTLDTVTVTIKAGTRMTGTSYGLLAGTISPAATLSGVSIQNGTLQIDSSAYFSTDDYSVGLLCGTGDTKNIDFSSIQCVAVGENAEQVTIDVNGNTVLLTFGQ